MQGAGCVNDLMHLDRVINSSYRSNHLTPPKADPVIGALGHLERVSEQSGSRRAEEVIRTDYNNTSQ